MSSDWYVYVVECADETLYTGITTDPERRIREHNESSAGARYTRARRPVTPVAFWHCEDRSEAATEEARFKSFDRAEKLRRVRLASDPETYRAFEEEYLRVFGIGDVASADCRPLAVAGASETDEELVDDAERVRDLFDDLRGSWRELLPSDSPPSIGDLEIIFFEGPGLFDGHAIEIEGRFSVFFDMRLVESHLSEVRFLPEVHVAHETAHALHYGASSEMYPGRQKGFREEVWHRLVAEGLAVRLSERLLDCSPREALWFGLVGEERFAEWRRAAEKCRDELWTQVCDVRTSPRFDSEAWSRLFRGGGEGVDGRFGYLYGREIVARAERDLELASLLDLDADAWRRHIAAYFQT